MSFDKFRSRLLEYGIKEIIRNDPTSITFISHGGHVFTLSTEEFEVDYISPSGYADGYVWVQSDLSIGEKMEP